MSFFAHQCLISLILLDNQSLYLKLAELESFCKISRLSAFGHQLVQRFEVFEPCITGHFAAAAAYFLLLLFTSGALIA
jgi:hypothetical protein